VALLRHSDGVLAALATAGRKKAMAAATIATAHQALIETVRFLEAAMADKLPFGRPALIPLRA